MTNSVSRKILSLFKTALLYLTIFLSISFALDYWRGRDIPKSAIPEFNYAAIDGQHITNAEFAQNDVTILYYWATWCGPCKATTPSIKLLSKHFQVISIATASGSDQELQKYALKNNLSFPVINDTTQNIPKEWRAPVTPFIVFIRNGEIVGHTTGISTYPGLVLRTWLSAFK